MIHCMDKKSVSKETQDEIIMSDRYDFSTG